MFVASTAFGAKATRPPDSLLSRRQAGMFGCKSVSTTFAEEPRFASSFTHSAAALPEPEANSKSLPLLLATYDSTAS